VTSRAKTPKSFEGKLRRIVAGKKKPLTDIDSVFVHVRDLSAVRVATYEARHEAQVVDLICKRFVTDAGAAPTAEAKDYQADPAKRDNFYRATHVEVCLRSEDLVGTYANVARVPCEIQVCSMMAHVWNEIEHDLGYKPFSGSLSTFERDQLKHLGMMVRTADGIISQLLKATDERLGAETTPFADVYDFVARLRPWFPGVDFGKHAGPLFEVLRPLRLLTPEAIRRQIDLPDPLAAGAVARCNDFWTSNALLAVQLEPNSSDLLLVALLPRMARIFARSAGGAADAGLARLQLIARTFIDPEGTVSELDAAAPLVLAYEPAAPSIDGARELAHERDVTLTPDHVLRKVMVAYMAGLKRCHHAVLRGNRTARGKVLLSFTVDEQGRTVDPEAAGFDLELDECLIAQMHNWRFDIPLDPNGKPTRATFQLTLVL
jgi:ppGpp synthetase/RelA/SpoT-type nucleotidyltranferase